MQFHLCDSKRLHFCVTSATSFILKKAPLLRGSGSSSCSIGNFAFSAVEIRRKDNMKSEKVFFESCFSALQALHFNFKFNKNQYSKGFNVVTIHTKTQDFVTKRNRIRNAALQRCYKSLVTRMVKDLSHFVTFVTGKVC